MGPQRAYQLSSYYTERERRASAAAHYLNWTSWKRALGSAAGLVAVVATGVTFGGSSEVRHVAHTALELDVAAVGYATSLLLDRGRAIAARTARRIRHDEPSVDRIVARLEHERVRPTIGSFSLSLSQYLLENEPEPMDERGAGSDWTDVWNEA